MKRIVSLFSLIVMVITVHAQDVPINDDWNTSTAVQMLPRLAKHPTGPAMVVWSDTRNGNNNPDIYMQFLGAKGFVLPGKLNMRVNDDQGEAIQVFPDVSMTEKGHSVVVWSDTRDGYAQIMGQYYLANADTLGTNFVISSDTSMGHITPSVGAGSGDRFIVVWSTVKPDESSRDIFAQWYDGYGEPSGANYCVNLDTAGNQIMPRIAMNHEGRFVVTWLRDLEGIRHVFARAFDEQGQSLGPEFQVSQSPLHPTDQVWPNVAMAATGRFMVTWYAPNGDGQMDVFSRGYNAAAVPQCDVFQVNERYGTEDHRNPDIAPSPNTNFEIAWHCPRLGNDDIYSRSTSLTGEMWRGSQTVTGAAGAQQYVAVVEDDYQNQLFVWWDNRNGNWDIYSTRQGLYWPNHTFAGSGFDGKVTLAWDPPYGHTRVDRYIIRRSTSMYSVGEVVHTLDPSTRALPNQMLDWIDTDVINGQKYWYYIQMDAAESLGAHWGVSATPSAGGHRLQSAWAHTAPVIDGRIEAGAWMDAKELEIAGPGTPDPARLMIMNSEDRLYLALGVMGDVRIEPGSVFGILFDDNHDGQWPPYSPGDEGALLFYEDQVAFNRFSGTYPDDLFLQSETVAEGVEWKYIHGYGTVLLEIAIDLDTVPLRGAPGDTVGVSFWWSDPGHYFNNPYGHTAAWPQGFLWETAQTLGELVLAAPSDTLAEYAWTMLNHNPGRTSFVQKERVLAPPFDSTKTVFFPNDRVEEISWYDGVYYLGTASSGLPNRFLALDGETETMIWNFDIPNSVASVGFHPAVSPDMIYCGGQYGDGLYALDRQHGHQIWSDPIGSLFCRSAILDGQRLYVSARDELICYDAVSGTRLWVFEAAESSFFDVAPAIDEKQCYWTNNDSIRAFNKYDGRVIWCDGTSGISDLAVDESHVYTYRYGGITALSKSDGSTVWTTKITENDTLSIRNRLAVSHNDLCFRIVADEDSLSRLITLDKRDGILQWQHQFTETLRNTPTIANGVVYLVTDYVGSLWAFDLSNGDSLFHDSSMRYMGQPIVADHKLMVPADSNRFKVLWNRQTTDAEQEFLGPKEFVLCQNYPNPFNPKTKISFSLNTSSQVTLTIYDVLGREVCSLVNRAMIPGQYRIEWDASDAASGIYFYKLSAAGNHAIRKMMLLK